MSPRSISASKTKALNAVVERPQSMTCSTTALLHGIGVKRQTSNPASMMPRKIHFDMKFRNNFVKMATAVALAALNSRASTATVHSGSSHPPSQGRFRAATATNRIVHADAQESRTGRQTFVSCITNGPTRITDKQANGVKKNGSSMEYP